MSAATPIVNKYMIGNQTNHAESLTLPSAKSTPCQPHRSKLSISLVDSHCFVGRRKTFPCKYKIRKKKNIALSVSEQKVKWVAGVEWTG